MAPCLVNVCGSAVTIAINRQLADHGGDLAIGAYGIINRILILFAMLVIGLTQGMQPIIGSQIIIGNFFQAIGKARLAIFLSLTRQMLFLLPFLLVLPRFWGQDGVWASLPLADVLSFIVTLLFIRRFLKYYRLKNRHYLLQA